MATPKIFQSFNSLLGQIVRKKNSTIVGPSKQLVGEYPEVDFQRLYDYYNHWPMIKRSIDVEHQKFIGSGIQITSNNEDFNLFIKRWMVNTKFQKKMSDAFLSLFITGNYILEKQFTPDKTLANVEQIPMQTFTKVFRDQFANEVKLVQIIDGVFKEVDPQYVVHYMINNPDRAPWGRSEFHTVASPRPVTPRVDPSTGSAINPERVLMPLLDAQAILQNAEVEIKQKMAKPRIFAFFPGMPRDQLAKLQLELEDDASDKYIWAFDKKGEMVEASVSPNVKFAEYGMNVDAQIDLSMGYASQTVTKPGGFSYSSSQTPFDSMDQRMVDLQSDAADFLKDKLIKPLALSWGYKDDFEDMEVKISFMPTVRRLSMEDIQKLPTNAVSPEEIRSILKLLNIPLDDDLWDEHSQKMEDKEDEQNKIAADQAKNGFNPTAEQNPTAAKSKSTLKDGHKIDPQHEKDRPKPASEINNMMCPNCLTNHAKYMHSEGTIIGIECNMCNSKFANERVTLPPYQSNDLYVSQGLDTPGVPEITDPEIRSELHINDDNMKEEETPIEKEKDGIPDDRTSGYKQEGDFKDPWDLENKEKPERELGVTDKRDNLGTKERNSDEQEPVVTDSQAINDDGKKKERGSEDIGSISGPPSSDTMNSGSTKYKRKKNAKT
jgi:hypothetical protein